MLSSGRTPSGPSPHLSSEELKWHRWIQDSVVPLLGEGVVCAMRDQPNDPAAYLAEFLAAKSGSAEMARTLSSRKLAGECARLDAELKALHEQLQTARAEAQRRLPNATLLEAVEQKEPSGQVVHMLAAASPAVALNEPARHGSAADAPSSQKDPAGHVTHAVSPSPSWKVPATHLSHSALLATNWKVPGLHSVCSVLPVGA